MARPSRTLLDYSPMQLLINVTDLQDTSDSVKSKAKAATAAAILFTSGSTEVPKGVVLPHCALRNTIE